MNQLSLSSRVQIRLRTVGEFASFLVKNGRWWLLPMLLVLGLTALLLGAVHVIEFAAPFVYTVF